ncbi:hypothetical protein LEP1GSC058_2825 [Leptospira fainei serovar Hurstbridge str. BUT 6]|uniref:Uncharacterized protein n=1 Tax=Leptospira fainei serovar Hurstbridge str. BUT 6 TaxID=1193011 RepID=S3UV48_9LEPT|nr:hypothetical protein LEP1GSC058_2825 [Leptospira fainei serovar Hurstbridge str. BUT 6]
MTTPKIKLEFITIIKLLSKSNGGKSAYLFGFNQTHWLL